MAGCFALTDVGVGDDEFYGVVALLGFFETVKEAFVVLAAIDDGAGDEFFADDDGRCAFCASEAVTGEDGREWA